MPEPLKNIYNKSFFNNLTSVINDVVNNFNPELFLKQIFDPTWDSKELKQRMRHISETLDAHLTGSFSTKAEILLRIVSGLKKLGIKEEAGFEYMFLPDYIELCGVNEYETSIKAIEKITQFTSCEFAIRPFLAKYPGKGMQQMLKWSTYEHPMVRRLSTEGCRPRLPWAMALPKLKKDPTPILPILEILKNDTSESVRRSVANNLNDISKDNPNILIQLTRKWQGKSPETDWVIKHACRSLLKQGNKQVMRLFGFNSTAHIEIKYFEILTPRVRIGESLKFKFQLINHRDSLAKLRLEYGLYFKKANHSLSKKVFTISEKNYNGNSNTLITREQAFKPITTRKYYSGKHQISIIINGTEYKKYDFEFVS